MIHKNCNELERCQKLIEEFMEGKCLNPIWVIRAYYAVIIMLARNIKTIPLVFSYPYSTVYVSIKPDKEYEDDGGYEEEEEENYKQEDEEEESKNVSSYERKVSPVETAATYYVGKKINYFLNRRYYREATVIDYVPAGKQPPKKYWKSIGHRSNYVPKIRKYDSVVVKLENGKICWPPLDVHTEIYVKQGV
jgi:hypothetical protein